jgi:hypothetical protein
MSNRNSITRGELQGKPDLLESVAIAASVAARSISRG